MQQTFVDTYQQKLYALTQKFFLMYCVVYKSLTNDYYMMTLTNELTLTNSLYSGAFIFLKLKTTFPFRGLKTDYPKTLNTRMEQLEQTVSSGTRSVYRNLL